MKKIVVRTQKRTRKKTSIQGQRDSSNIPENRGYPKIYGELTPENYGEHLENRHLTDSIIGIIRLNRGEFEASHELSKSE